MQRRQCSLTEWKPADVRLSAEDAIALATGRGDFSVTPLASGLYRVVPSQWVGSIALGEVDVVVRPKVRVERLFHLISYSPRLKFRAPDVSLDDHKGVTESIIRAFLMQMSTTLRRGPLMAYRGMEDALTTVRGRVRMIDQARRRFNFLLPVEVSFDEFTIDVEENRILKAALRRIERTRLSDSRLRRQAGGGLDALEAVSDVGYDPGGLPEIPFTRLNRHYEPAVVLAKAIIKASTPDLLPGRTEMPSFLLDMNKVFEDFLYRVLSEKLSIAPMKWRQGKRTTLDVAGRVMIEPDLSIWQGRVCRFVGDVKYKRTRVGEHEDLYQVISYARALGQAQTLLIYAESDET